MGYFPFYIDIENKKCVIVGGGKIALQKLKKIILFNPEITVIAPNICDEIEKIGVKTERRKFIDKDIKNAFMVISATDDEKLNAHIFELCKAENILVNTVDDKEKCGFIFPSIIKKDDVTVGITTSGKSPLYAKYLRQQIEDLLDGINPGIIDILSKYRPIIKAKINSEFLRKQANKKILNLCITSDKLPDDKQIYNMIEEISNSDEN
ncbi:MAG: bifunctional precorrin-2 dehydrogenase/sirohydrochlorin ferrochelatase [Clostridia bacterium]|nr:bifunctional precorrin-2 dehydrogenase/sirohydrochlorin ferrochelatase [Clostridia bacterium]